MAVAPDSPWRCTAVPEAVYAGMSGDHPKVALLGQVQGVAVHRIRGGGATQTPPLARQVANFVSIRSTTTRATPRK